MISTVTFGTQLPQTTYIERPGAYGIIQNDRSEVCLIKIHAGYTLPGGGIDPSESKEEALHREIREETGFSIDIQKYIGQADQYTYSKRDGKYYKKICFYFFCVLGQEHIESKEVDHQVIWVPAFEVQHYLPKQSAHAWGYQKANMKAI